MTNARPLSGLGVILAITLATTGAHAQQYRPDAEGYPCTARDRLTIIQDDQGYSIRSQPVAAQVTKEASATGIAIGSVVHAPQRWWQRTPRRRTPKRWPGPIWWGRRRWWRCNSGAGSRWFHLASARWSRRWSRCCTRRIRSRWRS